MEGGEYNLITPSIKYLIRMGIIGDMRTPQHLEETNLSILGALKNIFDIATDELIEDISILESRASKVKNKIPVDYNEICNKILELMGESIYSVFQAPDGHYFFLPDNSSITMRSQLEPDANVNGERLINPSRPISTIIFPIDSKTIIVAQSSKICPQKNNGIYQFSAKSVIDYNKIFIDNCREKVICENKTYLESFIAEHIKK